MNWKTTTRKVLLAATVLLALGASASERHVWRIGSFDHSSNEFRTEGVDYTNAKESLVYRVGKDTDKDWWRFQPGPANGIAGGRLHPFTIMFDLPKTPSGVYRLKLGVIYETPRLSSLRVEINGRSGNFYFHPKLDYANADWEGTFVPQTSSDTKIIDIPASWFKQGENKIVLTALDDPAKAENVLGSIAPGQSGIVYDALELSHDASARYDERSVKVSATPTLFFRKGAGGLSEVVEVIASFNSAARRVSIKLTANGKTQARNVSVNVAFGEVRSEIEMPEWSGTTAGDLELTIDGRSRRFPVRLTAAKKWTVYVVPHEHLDIGFTDYPAKVAELHAQSIDHAADAIRRFPDFRWTLDGYWVLDQYLKGRSPEKHKEVLTLLRDGKIVLPPQYANQHTGTASLESLARSFYDAHQFASRNDVPLGAAHIVDVPSYTWSYASVLHDAGVKYFLAAANNWRAPILLQARWNEKSPFYWEGPDGKRVLMWYSRAYLQLHTLFGGPPTIAAAKDAMPVFLQAYTRPDYTANSTIIFGSQLENTKFSKEQAEFAGNWNAEFAYPRVVPSTVTEAMSSIEREAGGKFPVFRGDFGPYWEDGFGSDAAPTATHRANLQRVLSAEKLAAATAVIEPAVRADNTLLRSAWENILLYDEHTWTYVGATTQPDHQQAVAQTALKRARTTEARRAIDESVQRSWSQFGSLLASKDNALVAFNPMNWERSGLVTTDLQDGNEIVDTVTGASVPFEIVATGRGTRLPGFGAGYKRVRFVAEKVPALGYKSYAIRPTTAQPAPEGQVTTQDVIESAFYRVTLDSESGAIRQVFDKQLGRELVDAASPYRFGAFLYVTGADNMPNNSLYRYAAGPAPKLEVHQASQGRIVSVRRTPFGTVAVLESQAKNTPLVRTEITVFDSEKKIELAYRVRKDDVLSKESAYFAFPVAMPGASFAYSNQTGWVDPARDSLPGASREWFTVSHWAAVRDPNASVAVVPVDAPLMAFGDIVRGAWPEQFRRASSTMFSWVMNNYWGTNFVSHQGGDFTFRYAIFSDKDFDTALLTRRAWNQLAPLESSDVLASIDTPRIPPAQGSLLEVDAQNVVASTWKPSEDGRGSILRIQETSGRTSRVRISSKLVRLESAFRCSLVEEDQQKLEISNGGVEIEIKPYEVLTLRLGTSVTR
ncbi:MAG TPA: polysaccharide lyase family protein [Terriglobales bacterium]|nr:polysaccharide lyase family protein [Terriglobales bacterium]